MSLTNKFNLEIYDKGLNLLHQFEILEENYVLELSEKSYYSVTCLESFVLNDVYYAFVGEKFGRIVSVNQQNEVNEYKIALGIDAFDYEIFDETNYSDNLERDIENAIIDYNNMFNDGLIQLNFERLTSTSGYYIQDDVKSFSDWFKELNKLYSIQVDIKMIAKNKLNIIIFKNENSILDIGFNDEKVMSYNINFSQNNPTMILINDWQHSWSFYLCADGSVDSGAYPDSKKTRLPIVKNKIVNSSENLTHDHAKIQAEEILLNSENNEIIIEYNTLGFDVAKLLGTFVNFYLPNGVLIKTSITKIESENNNSQIKKLTLGATRKNLIDKLKIINKGVN